MEIRPPAHSAFFATITATTTTRFDGIAENLAARSATSMLCEEETITATSSCFAGNSAKELLIWDEYPVFSTWKQDYLFGAKHSNVAIDVGGLEQPIHQVLLHPKTVLFNKTVSQLF